MEISIYGPINRRAKGGGGEARIRRAKEMEVNEGLKCVWEPQKRGGGKTQKQKKGELKEKNIHRENPRDRMKNRYSSDVSRGRQRGGEWGEGQGK